MDYGGEGGERPTTDIINSNKNTIPDKFQKNMLGGLGGDLGRLGCVRSAI